MYRKKMLYGYTALSYEDLLECDQKNKIELEYYKIKNTKDNIKVPEDSNTYGIEIIKKKYNNENNYIVEKSEIHNLTKNEKFVEQILEILKINKVTPISLDDVMYDLMKR